MSPTAREPVEAAPASSTVCRSVPASSSVCVALGAATPRVRTALGRRSSAISDATADAAASDSSARHRYLFMCFILRSTSKIRSDLILEVCYPTI